MDRFSVRLLEEDDQSARIVEFDACDAQVMLSWLEHDIRQECTKLSRNGRHTAQLLQLGRASQGYWMILPAEDGSAG